MMGKMGNSGEEGPVDRTFELNLAYASDDILLRFVPSSLPPL